jgi:hypothetical protein
MVSVQSETVAYFSYASSTADAQALRDFVRQANSIAQRNELEYRLKVQKAQQGYKITIVDGKDKTLPSIVRTLCYTFGRIKVYLPSSTSERISCGERTTSGVCRREKGCAWQPRNETVRRRHP